MRRDKTAATESNTLEMLEETIIFGDRVWRGAKTILFN